MKKHSALESNAEDSIAVLDPHPSGKPVMHSDHSSWDAAKPSANPSSPIHTNGEVVKHPKRSRTNATQTAPRRFAALAPDDEVSNRQAELFYLQKQIQLQTQMIFILEDGEKIQGVVEWYDRHSIKVRGKSRVLIYKSAIKYLYKAGEVGAAPEK